MSSGSGKAMTLYKYRNLTNLDWTIDILLKRRLYASKYVNLNDPMEGFFYHHGLSKSKLESILKDKLSFRICSLSKSSTDIGLWTFYADEGRGCCIEVEPETDGWKYKEIEYNQDVPEIKDAVNGQFDVPSIVRILCTKTERWKYEQEIRFIKSVGRSNQSTYLGVKLKNVILGYNINEEKKEIITTLVETLNKNRSHEDSIGIKKMTKKELTYDILQRG